MKHLILSGSTVVLLFCGVGCKDGIDSVSAGAQSKLEQEAQSVLNVSPAITFKTVVTKEDKKNYNAIAVMDSDGSDRTPIFIAATTAYNVYSPTWSPGAGRIAFHAAEGSTITINVISVSVVQGKPVGSDLRTIYSTTNAQLRGLSWSPIYNKLAFISRDTGKNGINTVQVIPHYGGVPLVLYRSMTDTVHTYNSPTWSPDGSKIAFVGHIGTYNGDRNPDTLRVINAKSGALLESVGLGETSRTTSCDWSHAGMNTIVFDADDFLYYVTPISGSVAWTDKAIGRHPSWSPDNSSVITYEAGVLQKTEFNSSSTMIIDTGGFSFPEWKKALGASNQGSIRRSGTPWSTL